MPLDLTPPAPGESVGTWGAELNSLLAAIETFVNGLESSLAGKAAAAHGHAEADVTGLVSDLTALSSAIAGKAAATRAITAGTGLSGGGDLTADRSLAVTFGSSSGTVCQGNDARLSDSRTPTAHVHSAADVTSGTLPVARGGTGVTSLADLKASLGLGFGASMFRAATSSSDSGTGVRTLTGYDTVRREDDGYDATPGTGLITVPDDGLYAVTAHCRFSAGLNSFAALYITDGTNELLRGDYTSWSAAQDLHVAGITDEVAAGTALRARLITSNSIALVGDAAGSAYYFRVVRVG